jgi:hypothetical protein
MKPKFYLITSFQDECEVEIQKSAYCPRGEIYLVNDKSRPILEHVRLLYQAEKEKNDWIRAYDNAIQGLNYWKAKAMHNHAK